MNTPSELARVIPCSLGMILLVFACLSLWTAFAIRSMHLDFHCSKADWEPFATTLEST
jgi:hypothetical protein